MSQDSPGKPVSLRQAFFDELARREIERRAREDAERAQQEADNNRAMALFQVLAREEAFLREKGLILDHTRYAVTLDHENFRLRAYFEDDKASVTSADKRNTASLSAAPRKQETVDSVEAAVELLAQYLADESF